jgi:hypothetical protein
MPVQKQGPTLFVEKGCSNCHNGVNVDGGTVVCPQILVRCERDFFGHPDPCRRGMP